MNTKLAFSYFTFCLFFLISCMEKNYQKIHNNILVADTHNDVVYSALLQGKDISVKQNKGHTDLPRLQEGGVNIQTFAIWSSDGKYGNGTAYVHANEQIDSLMQFLIKNPSSIALAKTPKEALSIVESDRIAAVIGLEGGHMIEKNLDYLVDLYSRGVRYMTLTWNHSLDWVGASAIENSLPIEEQQGLSEWGEELIKKMNEIGMMVDLSHVGERSFYDVLKVSTKPVLVSHSNAYALAPHHRNLKDEQLEALKKNKGVVGVNFYSGFLDSTYSERLAELYKKHYQERANAKWIADNNLWAMYEDLPSNMQRELDAPAELLLDHIDYLVEKVGIDHVCIGSDYDGIESAPKGLEDVSKFPELTRLLLERGYEVNDIEKIMGLNYMRIWRENQ